MNDTVARTLIKGNEAVAFGAVDAGCRCYFGYPITPQNEIPETMSRLLPSIGGHYVQAESEVAAASMLLGACAAGVPSMTSSSGCGISLMQEALSYMSGSMLPAVLVNMARGGPGLGDIGPSQGDYFQAVKGGGHGDHRNIVLAPATAQECYDFMFRAFALAFTYANPVMVLGDAIVGQIKEPVRRTPPADALSPAQLDALAAPWRVEGRGKRGPDAAPRLIKSVYLAEGALAARNRLLQDKYEAMRAEARSIACNVDDADLVVVAYGSIARAVRSTLRTLREQGLAVGLFRPVTLYPFPDEALRALAAARPGRRFLVVEQNLGQMVEDVRLALFGAAGCGAEVLWHGLMPGLLANAQMLEEPVRMALAGKEMRS